MERIEECISFLLGKAYQQVNQQAKKRLAPFGVTPVQYALIKVLWGRDGLSGAELGERLRLDSATVTGMLDRLESADFIERRPHERDRRINLVYLTPRGRSLQEPLDADMDAFNAEVFGRFSVKDAEKLRSLLETLGEAGVAR